MVGFNLMNLTFISDTHNKHGHIPKEFLLGGDIIFHTGDISSRGYIHEVENFLKWYNSLDSYKYKILIAGNHDFLFEYSPQKAKSILENYPNVIYLQDSGIEIQGLNIWGSPWQPEFYNWAFNLPRKGAELLEKWKMIPRNCDILLTHGPPKGILDKVPDGFLCGCEILYDEIIQHINPKVHAFGHIHCGYGIQEHEGTHFINASSLNEEYKYANKPINIKIDEEKKVSII